MSSQYEKFINVVSLASGFEKQNLSLSTTVNGLDIDSLKFIGLMVDLEQEFNIEMSEDDMDIGKYKTLQDIYNILIKTAVK